MTTSAAVSTAAPRSDKLEEALTQVRQNQSQWTEVPTMSGEGLFELFQEHQRHSNNNTNNEEHAESDFVLVDVRSKAERRVSVIANSISLKEYNEIYAPKRNKNPSDGASSSSSSGTKVILYCTIGYRSGMEATHLLHRDPSLNGRIYNMAGIVAFSHAVVHHAQGQGNTNITDATGNMPTNTTASPRTSLSEPSNYHRTPTVEALDPDWAWNLLVDPATQSPTRLVHTFGDTWDLCPENEIETRQFSTLALLWQFLTLFVHMMVRFLQRCGHSLHKATMRSNRSPTSTVETHPLHQSDPSVMAVEMTEQGEEEEEEAAETVGTTSIIPPAQTSQNVRPFATSASGLRARSSSNLSSAP